jgi:hypothetical protein
MFRVPTPSTPPTTDWITPERMDGGSTSVGPFGFLLIEVMSLHDAIPPARAATTAPRRIPFLMIGSSPAGATA